MKKLLVLTILACVTLCSCTKEGLNKAPAQEPSAANREPVKLASDPSREHLIVDLAGITFHNDCTNEEMLVISGVLNVNRHQDGTVASLNIHDFVLQSSGGTIYRGIYVQTFQVTTELPDPGAFNNTYKLILTTPGGGNNSVLKGVFHITQNGNGEFAVVIDNFTAGCK